MKTKTSRALGRRKRILLLDKNQKTRDQHAIVLHASGYDVESAGNDPDAYLLCDSFRPDLVLVGFSEPTAGTRDVTDKMRRQNPNQRIAFLPRESLYLCPVFYNGELLRNGEGSAGFVERVEALLGNTQSEAIIV